MLLQPGGWVPAFMSAAAEELRLPHREASLPTLQVLLASGDSFCMSRADRKSVV